MGLKAVLHQTSTKALKEGLLQRFCGLGSTDQTFWLFWKRVSGVEG